MKFYVEKKQSKNNGKPYVVLMADTGYSQKAINFEQSTICELLDCSPRVLSELKVGESIEL